MAKGGKLALIEKPGAYLVSTARNLLTDRARADTARLTSQHHSFEDEDIAGPDPHAALEARDTMRRVGEAIEKLKPQTGSISRSEEHTSELQSLMRSSYAVFCLKKKINNTSQINLLQQ